MKTITRLAVLSIVCMSISFLVGCSKSETASSGSADAGGVTTAKSGDSASTGGTKQGNGSLPDVSVQPAPSGVKTGTEGGKK